MFIATCGQIILTSSMQPRDRGNGRNIEINLQPTVDIFFSCDSDQGNTTEVEFNAH